MNIKQLRWSGSTTGQRVCSSVPGSCVWGKPTVLSGDVQKGHLTSSCPSGFTLSGELRRQTRDCAKAIYLQSQTQLFEKVREKKAAKCWKVDVWLPCRCGNGRQELEGDWRNLLLYLSKPVTFVSASLISSRLLIDARREIRGRFTLKHEHLHYGWWWRINFLGDFKSDILCIHLAKFQSKTFFVWSSYFLTN